jgi:acyl-CoA reductase-like NAD-dependent aldehyde dehydrogenase
MNMTTAHPFWLAGKAATSGNLENVTHPGDGSLVAQYHVPTKEQVDQAVSAAWNVRQEFQRTTAAQRAEALMHISKRLSERVEEIAQLILEENGKPIMWARAEAGRATTVFRWAAEEVRRFSGEIQRLDTEAAAAGRMAIIRRFPHGPVLGISPFNFPMNLVAHKVAPAIAVGAPIIVKPAPSTPLSALLLGEILAEVDLPQGSWSILPIANADAPALVADPRLPVVSFTGSDKVGYEIQKAVPNKHITLELGGNAAAIVNDDWNSEADLTWAATRIATFANYQAGQSCISVQRVLIHENLYDQLTVKIVEMVAGLKNGDPRDDKTVVGPLINEAAAIRVEEWVNEAVAGGAKVLTGGKRNGSFYEPTVLANVPTDAKVSCNEIFGPVMMVNKISSFEQGIALVNDSIFGLQAGVFTHDIQKAFHAHRELEVGGVIVGDVPTFRSDQMPYGGVKASGVGKEGLRYAMQDFTHERILVLSGIDL